MDINKIYCCDSVRVLQTFPPECVDLIITSPPSIFDFEANANEIYRVMKTGGVVVWVVQNSIESLRQALYFDNLGLGGHDTMLYEKISIYPKPPDGFSQAFEFMFVFSKGKPKTARLLCDKKNRWAGIPGFGTSTQRKSNGELIKYIKKRLTPDFSPRSNIWRYYVGVGYTSMDPLAYEHPNPMPDLLPFDHISTWSREQEIVMDPFVSAGTVCVMAKILGRNYIGIDTSKEYCSLTERRLTNSHIYNVEKMIEISAEVYNSRYRQDSPSQVKRRRG